MLLSILSRLGAGQQLLTPAESDPRAPQVLLGVPRLGGAAQAPRSLPTALIPPPFAQLGEPPRMSHPKPGQGSDPG